MERIRELREEKNITQLQISLVLGVSQETISSYERGKTYPSCERLMKLARYFHVSTDYLLGISNIRQPELYTTVRLDAYQQRLIQAYNRIPSQKRKETLLAVATEFSD